ncbi:terpenoid synthase [Multifurca ochricompacta]|uniref:Terpene synthase n=1 Tax=Multifurca ochricompacta TaxID=376703 RepID=A0AAD4M1N2_9AGAM|nr:terpenoid synthase [Multifurca ochricompacta]
MTIRFYMPDTLENWKWPRHLNPHHVQANEASSAWFKGFKAFSPKAQEAFDRCELGLFTSLAYPLYDEERLRSCCDLMNLYFLFDEYSDLANEDEAQLMANIIMDALRNPHTPRPKGEWIGGEVTRQFWERTIKTASLPSQKRFIETFEPYVQGVVRQAADRDNGHNLTIQEYFEVRRDDIGTMPAFAMLELEMNIPDDAIHHPAIEELSVLATDMILLDNDIVSYNKEQARDNDSCNIITILMHQNKTDIQGAMDWIYEHRKGLERTFMDIYENKIPKFGEPVDKQLAQYVDGLGNWVRANGQWGFETERYFGKRGAEFQKTRWVKLLPKRDPDEIGHQLVDELEL